jgi:hypothetical protein
VRLTLAAWPSTSINTALLPPPPAAAPPSGPLAAATAAAPEEEGLVGRGESAVVVHSQGTGLRGRGSSV